MEAKDTVMSVLEMDDALNTIPTHQTTKRTQSERFFVIAKAQAEISFKARQDEIDLLQSIINSKDAAITDLESLLELAKEYAGRERKAGIKEVVELIGREPFEHNYSMRKHEEDDCFACRYEVKLKDWGINTDS